MLLWWTRNCRYLTFNFACCCNTLWAIFTPRCLQRVFKNHTFFLCSKFYRKDIACASLWPLWADLLSLLTITNLPTWTWMPLPKTQQVDRQLPASLLSGRTRFELGPARVGCAVDKVAPHPPGSPYIKKIHPRPWHPSTQRERGHSSTHSKPRH